MRKKYLLYVAIIITLLCLRSTIKPQSMEDKSIGERADSAKTLAAVIATGGNAEESILNWNTLTGDWFGVREGLSLRGVDFILTYTGEAFSSLSGGIKAGGGYLDKIDIKANFDFEKIFNWSGASLSLYTIGMQGGDPFRFTGAGQWISNIESADVWRLFEARFEQNLFDGKLSLLAGLYDVNSEFDMRITSSLFTNPSHGIGADFSQSGKNGPSIFPTSSLAFRVYYKPNLFYIRSAVLDGVPGNPENPNGTQIILRKEDGLLLTTETGLINGGEDFSSGYEKFAAGAWYYTERFPDIYEQDVNGQPVTRSGNYGAYAFAEKFIFAEASDLHQGLAAFIRAGFADPDINKFHYYCGAGFSYTGLIPDRDNDVAGIAVATVVTSEKFRRQKLSDGEPVRKYETDIEITYSLKLTPYFIFQPVAQYVINPLDAPGAEHAFIALARFQFIF
ncbi:MAG: carbohydrate porin [Ignavibacteria bacterium]